MKFIYNFEVQNNDNGKTTEPLLPLSEPISQGKYGTLLEGTRRTEEIKAELTRRSQENVRDARKDSQEISKRERIK